jgi:hypothetical protein
MAGVYAHAVTDASEARPDPSDRSSLVSFRRGGAGHNDEGGTAMQRITRMRRIRAVRRSGSSHQRPGALGVRERRSPHPVRSLGRESDGEMARGGAERPFEIPPLPLRGSAAPREPPGTVLVRMCEEGHGTPLPHPPKSLHGPGARSRQRPGSVRFIRLIRSIAVHPSSLTPERGARERAKRGAIRRIRSSRRIRFRHERRGQHERKCTPVAPLLQSWLAHHTRGWHREG